MKITIRSSFHQQMAVKVQVPADGILTQSQLVRIQRGLCSGGGCLCGGLARSTIDQGGTIEFCGSDASGARYRYNREES